MADPIWEKLFRGEYVSIALEDMTVQRMRELKSAFGYEYGTPATLWQRLQVGDMDALAAALWIHGQVVGKPIRDPLALDFNVTEFAMAEPKPKPKKKPDPTRAATRAETTSSETPTNSEESSSSS